MALLDVERLRAYYMLRRGSVKAVDGIDMQIYEREIVGIVGESGCGKTTLARVLALDITPPLKLVDGRIVIEDIDVTQIPIPEARKRISGTKIAIIPQAAMNALVPTLRVREFIADVLKEKRGIEKKEAIELAKKRFEELNLPIRALDLYPFELSGGMRQRALIALATLLNPSILIADEPTSALDVSTQKTVLATLYEVYSKGFVKSIIFISHDIATVRQIATRMIVMYAGKIVEVGPTDDIIEKPLHPYTKLLMYSILTPETQIRKRVDEVKHYRLIGEPPSLVNPPQGCRFHPRCPFAMDICRKEEQSLIEVEPRRYVSCWLYVNK